MRIFLSYASEHRQIADRLAIGLRSEGNEVFFDRDQLPPGDSYDSRIREAIKGCDLMVFLVGPESVARGSYALTELEFAREKWNSPAGHVLPVFAATASMNMEELPPYLRAVTILAPSGDLVPEVLGHVAKLKKSNSKKLVIWTGGAIAALGTMLMVVDSQFPPEKRCRLHLGYNPIPTHVGTLITRTTVKGVTHDTFMSEEGISFIDVSLSGTEAWQIEVLDANRVLSGPVRIIGCPSSLEEKTLDGNARLSIRPRS